ncbi:MAG: sterol desaturase family protein [Deltaproteobacteria bacterium]|nr:sterol desaturase family protein [Deltaproteobacteria bacterium]
MNYKLVVGLIFLGFAVLELRADRLLHRAATRTKDIIIELGSGLGLPIAVVPAVIAGSGVLTEALAPDSAGALAHWPTWLMFATLLVIDDLGQYLWHRLTHAVPSLFELHRAHHSATYMSVRIVYRNNILYYAMMPNLWASGVLLYLGFDDVYYVYFIAKMAVIIGAHSSVAWDEPLLKIRWLRPVMWLVVRTISTPSTHAAHHGKHATDGVTHYKGNYGNFLFLWDVLLGTAKISERRPAHFGLENIDDASWQQELLWPWLRARPRLSAKWPWRR